APTGRARAEVHVGRRRGRRCGFFGGRLFFDDGLGWAGGVEGIRASLLLGGELILDLFAQLAEAGARGGQLRIARVGIEAEGEVDERGHVVLQFGLCTTKVAQNVERRVAFERAAVVVARGREAAVAE